MTTLEIVLICVLALLVVALIVLFLLLRGAGKIITGFISVRTGESLHDDGNKKL